MKVPVHIAIKLMQLSQGESIPSSLAKHSLIENLVSEGILERKGRIKKSLSISDNKALFTYLQNHFGINNLEQYIAVLNKDNILRNELTEASANSKLKRIRTFKGFLINCYNPIEAVLNGKQITLHLTDGTFQFIYDFENFLPTPDITIVGIENPENFRHINRQKYLFKNINPLFVSRYPQNQSKDLIKWLKSIPNNYFHFGDFDFAGLNIYFNEYKKHLQSKSTFFIPPDIEKLLSTKGNRDNYNKQSIQFDLDQIKEENILTLISLIKKHKKGLEQEILVKL